MIPSDQHAPADPGVSAWVSAAAGTGKTRVLTDRVLRLLLEGNRPGRLLCLTFTKAASAEMTNRVHGRLADWARLSDAELGDDLDSLLGTPASEEHRRRARRLFAEVLEAPGGLRIQTIHAFCESVLGRFPLEADLAPHFAVADERTAAELLDEARERVLSQARHDGDLGAAIGEIIAHVNERDFADVMAKTILERSRLGRLIARHGSLAEVVAAVRRGLGLAVGEDERSILAAACEDGALDGAALKHAAEAMLHGGKTDARNGQTIAQWLADPVLRVADFEHYLGVYFTKGGRGEERKSLVHAEALALAPDAADVLRAEAARLTAVRERLNAAYGLGVTAALLRLGAALIEAYSALKRRRAMLDYDDLILRARDLLQRPGVAPWVLYKLDGGLDHILIDEAQDTNPEQWEVIAALAEEFFAGEGARETERTIFAVGDAKQSIYGFQRADPASFARWREYFAERVAAAGQPWRAVELVRSFRSAEPVLAAVDRVFAPPAVHQGVVFDDRVVRHESSREGQAGVVEVWPLEKPDEPTDPGIWEPPVARADSRGPSARLADRIARCISGWFARDELLPSRGRPIRPGDIMILVQRRSAFVDEMVRALKQTGIDSAGIDRLIISDEIAVMDLIALGRFALLPEDDLTLAVVLRSPLVGLAEEELFRLAYGRGEATLWRTLVEGARDELHLHQAHAFLAAALARADFMPPFEFYAEALGAGGRRNLVSRLGPEANEPIDELLGRALEYERDHVPSLQGFLHWLYAGNAEVRRDLDHGRDEIRVLTVHGAKGLEAPIVFLPDTCRVPTHDDPLLWPGDDLVLWRPRRDREDPVARAARETAQARQREEYRRLLYVALTRAEDRLYVCGWETRNGRGKDCWYDLVRGAIEPLADRATLEGGDEGLRLESVQRGPPDRPDEPPAWAHETGPVPPWAERRVLAEAPAAAPLTPSRPEDEAAVRSPLDAEDQAASRRGFLVHRLLETLPDLAAGERAAAARHFLAQPALGLDEAEAAEIAQQTLGVLDDPAFAMIFGPGSRAEVSLSGRLGDRVVSGRIDRLAVLEDEVLVVDYKTNRKPPADQAGVPALYVRQMATYRALLSEIYPGRKVRCALLWTDTPTLMPLEAAVLDNR